MKKKLLSLFAAFTCMLFGAAACGIKDSAAPASLSAASQTSDESSLDTASSDASSDDDSDDTSDGASSDDDNGAILPWEPLG